ncbi:MAG: phosphoenolpyruvate carboxykinase (ATP) [Deltaproteobacteria bacterium]|nr:phosphoenolpyruvate carboxykinase (ATP) [Deltaproteobacteria bacterium]
MSGTHGERLSGWLRAISLSNPGKIHDNLVIPALVEEACARREGVMASGGAFVVRTGAFTGRAAQDKFVVKDAQSEAHIDWLANKPFAPAQWKNLYSRLLAYLQGREIFIQDATAGADPKHKLGLRVLTTTAWHSHFVRNMFVVPSVLQRDRSLGSFSPEFSIFHVPDFRAAPELDGTRSPTFVVINFGERKVIIGGTGYAGEIKKSVFTIMNYLKPLEGILTMHCSANVGESGDSALFFGLSGTGKTTLSADPKRRLIGDDEHGWSDEGIFNIEGGCYAKVINLSAENEPAIYATTKMFGTILENVAIDPVIRHLDLQDASITENTRASYRLSAIPSHVPSGVGPPPKNIVFLTCDSFGVLPPLSRLTTAQAVYHFLSGYTARVAGTEVGVKEPTATFSACFGAPFMPLHPSQYAKLLGKKMAAAGSSAWLVNTGWTGGPYGEGQRMSIKHTRALLDAALSGALGSVSFQTHPVFGLDVPTTVEGVPSEVLDAKKTWKDPAKYDLRARHVARLFADNFKKYDSFVDETVRAAGPRISE